MICKVCGRGIANEEANFCEYCGTSFREVKPEDMIQQQVEHIEAVTQQSVEDKPVSFLQWIGTFIVSVIPIVGLVMMFVWAFNSNGNANKRNWARATLVFGIIIMIIYMLLVANMVNDIYNSGMSVEEYINSMYTY